MTNSIKTFEQAQELVAKHLPNQDVLAPLARSQAVAIMAAQTLPGVILPESMRLIASSDDVDAAVTRVAKDDALVLSVLFALGSFVQAKLTGAEYSTDSVQKFYDDYAGLTDEQKEAKGFEVACLLDDMVNLETLRTVPEEQLEDAKKESEEAIAEVKEKCSGKGAILPVEAVAFATSFLTTLAIIIIRDTAKGHDIEECRQQNRIEGMIGTMVFKHAVSGIVNQMVRELMSIHLPADVFDTIEAMFEALDAEKH